MKTTACLSMLLAAWLASPAGAAEDLSPAAKVTVTGRIDQPRYEALKNPNAQRQLDAADAAWKRRKYAEARAGYEKFLGLVPAEAPARSYALFMQGACLLKEQAPDKAIGPLEEVVSKHGDTQEALLARVYLAGACVEQFEWDKALGHYLAVVAAEDKFTEPALLKQARLWLRNHYNQQRFDASDPQRQKQAEQAWLELAMKLAPDEAVGPRDQPTRAYEELLAYLSAQGDWAGFAKVAGLTLTPERVQQQVVIRSLENLERRHQAAAGDARQLAELLPKYLSALKELEPQVAALKAGDAERHQAAYFRLVECYARAGQAAATDRLMGLWLQDHKGDRVALFAWAGYMLQFGNPTAAFDAAFEAHLRGHAQDTNAADTYIKVIRERGADKRKALAVLDQFKADDYKRGLFWQGLDAGKATGHFAACADDAKTEAATRTKAAWLAAEGLREQGKLVEADKYYALSDNDIALYWRGEALAAQGKWKEAAEHWTKTRDAIRSRPGRPFRGLAYLRTAEVLLEHQDEQGPAAARAALKQVDAPLVPKVEALMKKHGVAPEAPGK